MRVLITGPTLPDPGGISNYFSVVLPHLRQRIDAVEYFELGSTRAASRWHIVDDQLRFAAAVKRFRPDVVHVNPTLNLKCYLRDGMHVRIAAAHGVPVFVFFRGWNLPFARRVDGWLGQYFLRTFARATSFAVLAASFGRHLQRWNVHQPVHLATTAIADIDFSTLDIEQIIRSRARQPRRILYLSRLEPDKGFLETIEAVRRLLKSGRNISLTVAGSGPGEDELRQRVADQGLAESIHIAGYARGRSKMELLKSHSIFCLPTQYEEGLPNAMLEAMGAGMTIITSMTGGISDMFIDQDMGDAVPPRDTAAIQQSIERLLDDPERLKRTAVTNHRYATDRFLASKAADWLVQRYQECLPAASVGSAQFRPVV